MTVPDPYFGGAGPDRTGLRAVRALHGRLPAQRQEHAASRTTCGSPSAPAPRSSPEREVVDVKPIGAPDGSEGYEVTTERPGAWLRRDRRRVRARGVVIAAGALGTNKLLARCKRAGSLPRVSDRLGRCVRTNSEAILAVTLPKDHADLSSASRSPRASTPIPTRTSRRSPTATRPTR